MHCDNIKYQQKEKKKEKILKEIKYHWNDITLKLYIHKGRFKESKEKEESTKITERELKDEYGCK